MKTIRAAVFLVALVALARPSFADPIDDADNARNLAEIGRSVALGADEETAGVKSSANNSALYAFSRYTLYWLPIYGANPAVVAKLDAGMIKMAEGDDIRDGFWASVYGESGGDAYVVDAEADYTNLMYVAAKDKFDTAKSRYWNAHQSTELARAKYVEAN